MTDKEMILCYTAKLYNTPEPRCESIEGKKLRQLAASQLVKFIQWLEKEAEKLPEDEQRTTRTHQV